MNQFLTTRSGALKQIMRVVVMGVLSAAAIATPAQAQSTQPSTTTVVDPGHWTVTPYIGVGFSGDLDSGATAVGVAGGYVYNPRVSFEGDFNYLPSTESSGVVEFDSKEWSLTGNVLYHFAGRSFVPYGAFGIGIGHGSIDADEALIPAGFDTSSTEFVWNFGGGVERHFRDRMAFRGDLRYFFGGDFVPDFWRLSAGVTVDLGKH